MPVTGCPTVSHKEGKTHGGAQVPQAAPRGWARALEQEARPAGTSRSRAARSSVHGEGPGGASQQPQRERPLDAEGARSAGSRLLFLPATSVSRRWCQPEPGAPRSAPRQGLEKAGSSLPSGPEGLRLIKWEAPCSAVSLIYIRH